MVATYAQRQAARNYTERQKQKGFNHHTVFCTDKQWMILKPFISLLKGLRIESIEEVSMDENGVNIKYSENFSSGNKYLSEPISEYEELKDTSVEQKNEE